MGVNVKYAFSLDSFCDIPRVILKLKGKQISIYTKHFLISRFDGVFASPPSCILMTTSNSHYHIVPLNDSFDLNILSFTIVVITVMLAFKLSSRF
jgi:hypothetical protein